MNKIVFLTGATGLVGGNLIPRILKDDSITRLILLVRGDTDKETTERVYEVINKLSPEMDHSQIENRIQVVRGDITLDRLGIPESIYNRLASEVTHVIHSAATVQFQLPLECARLVNYTGTRNIMIFAQHAQQNGGLKGVAYISTAYVSGDRAGRILENELACDQHFANTYEQTKFESEKLVWQLMSELPLTIFRPSIIVGDSKTGRTTAFNVLYPPLKLISHKMVRILPGSRYTPLDIVPVDFVANAINSIFLKNNEGIGKIYHLTAGDENSTTVGEVVDLAMAYIDITKIAGNLQPIRFIVPEEYHSAIQSLCGHEKRVWQAIETYAPYLCVNRTFDNANTCSALRNTGITIPDFKNYYQTILQYCIQTDWGKRLKLAA